VQKIAGDRWFYHPSREVYGAPEEIDLPYESVHFASGAFTLHGWFFPAAGEAKGTVVHCHGNGGNITGHFKFVAWLPAMRWNVLVFDYRGFGRSEGEPTRAGTIADAHAAVEYVRSRSDVAPERVVLLGQSLGASVGIVVASQRHDLAGAVFEGAFSSYRGAAGFVCRQSLFLWGVAPFTKMLVGAGLDPMEFVGNGSTMPKLFITGTADGICDHRQTIALHKAASDPKELWVIQGGEHLEALRDADGEGRLRVASFLSSCIQV